MQLYTGIIIYSFNLNKNYIARIIKVVNTDYRYCNDQ